MFPNLKEDLKYYFGEQKSSLKRLFYLFFNQSVWAIVVYRFGYWAHHHFNVPVLRVVLRIIAFLELKQIEILTGISIPFSAKIGKGFYIGHFGGIILNSDVVLGEYCKIGTGVVIGTKGLGDTGVPMIGNNVYIGVGAKILGGIRIGNNVRIGANAVVITDIPDNATAVGIPATVVKIGQEGGAK